MSSQIRIVPSLLPVAIRAPSAVIATARAAVSGIVNSDLAGVGVPHGGEVLDLGDDALAVAGEPRGHHIAIDSDDSSSRATSLPDRIDHQRRAEPEHDDPIAGRRESRDPSTPGVSVTSPVPGCEILVSGSASGGIVIGVPLGNCHAAASRPADHELRFVRRDLAAAANARPTAR